MVLGIEDLIIDRLRCWIHGSSDEDGRWARRLAMLYADTIDWSYLRDKSESVAAEAQAVEALAMEALPDEELR